MDKLIITSSYYNEHTHELQLYVGDAIYCTISCNSEPSDDEVDDIISDIEWEENMHLTQPHLIELINKKHEQNN